MLFLVFVLVDLLAVVSAALVSALELLATSATTSSTCFCFVLVDLLGFESTSSTT